MKIASQSRLVNPLILVAMVASGLMTNCDGCGDTKVNAVHPVTPSDKVSMDVPGCVSTSAMSYKTAKNLQAPSACGAIINGAEVSLDNNRIGLCPQGVAVPKSQSFQVYWTLCNTAAVRNDSVHGATQQSYNLRIMAHQDGKSVELTPSLSFTQPILDPCGCSTEIVVFNSPTDPNPAKKLAPGAYAFYLSAPYALAEVNLVTVTD
ncbi:MAG TPA: hypothetical protein VIV60_27510 [Polyangiaceae bacterium]